jgi:ParB family chromosome partitioning protein
VAGKTKKTGLDVDYLRTATSTTLASSVFATRVQEEEQRLIHEKQAQQIALERLLDNPYQPRVSMEEEGLQQLAETIAAHGFQGVLVARPHPRQAGSYQLTAGHRRREAAKRAGLKTLPVIVHPWSDQDMATLAATENIQREDLSPLEEGKLFQVMIDEMGLTQVDVANAIKKDRGYVRNRLRLASAPADIQAFVAAKADSMRAVIYLLDIEDPAERAPVIEQLLQRTLTTEDLPAYVEELKQRRNAPPALAAKVDAATEPPLPVAASTPMAPTPEAPDHTPGVSPASDAASRAPRVPARDLSQERVRQVKLKTIARYLGEYRRSLAGLAEVPAEELALLCQIEAMVRELI